MKKALPYAEPLEKLELNIKETYTKRRELGKQSSAIY